MKGGFPGFFVADHHGTPELEQLLQGVGFFLIRGEFLGYFDADDAGAPGFLKEAGDFRTGESHLLGNLVLGEIVLMIEVGDSG